MSVLYSSFARSSFAFDFCSSQAPIPLEQPGQTYCKCIQHKTGSQARFPGSKSRNNALHADCCKVTIELPAHAVATIRVFLLQEPFLRANEEYKTLMKKR